MPAKGRKKPSAKLARKATTRAKPSAKARKTAKPAARKKPATAKAGGAKPKPADKFPPLDLAAFPPETATSFERWLCLACVSDVFVHQLDLAPKTAIREINRYTPSIAELNASALARPWFLNQPVQKTCPYCGAPAKRHTRLTVYRIEGGKATDGLRRALLKALPQSGNKFAVLEEKATQQHAFFEWLDRIRIGLDLDNPVWLREVSRHYLGRKEPKTDWQGLFARINGIRRSRRLQTGWEVDEGRLFLAPALFDELLLVQYLVSRSHRAGGLTLEGRYTLAELFLRLRNAGYLRAIGINAQNPADALEQVVGHLSGGEAAVKFYYIVDRRDFLEKVKRL